MTALLTVLHAMACAVALAIALCNLNHMGRETHNGIRVAVWLMAVGMFAGLAGDVLFGHLPTLTETMLVVGLAAGLLSDRRRAHPHNCPCAFATLSRHDQHATD